jgi:hypothetical protein
VLHDDRGILEVVLPGASPEPPRRRQRRADPLALTAGPCGVQAHLVREGGLGPALPASSALPMILAGADIRVACSLVAAPA